MNPLPRTPGTWWRRLRTTDDNGLYLARVVRSGEDLLWSDGGTRVGKVTDDGLWVEAVLTPTQVTMMRRKSLVAHMTLEDLEAAAREHLGGARPDADAFTGAVADIICMLKKRLEVPHG